MEPGLYSTSWCPRVAVWYGAFLEYSFVLLQLVVDLLMRIDAKTLYSWHEDNTRWYPCVALSGATQMTQEIGDADVA